MIHLIAVVIFVFGFIAISLEHKLKVNKSAIALVLGSILWFIVVLTTKVDIGNAITETGAEIFEIVIFLLCAMSLVEILVHYKLFDVIRGKLFALHLKEKHQFLLVTLLTFAFSGIIDNLTTTIVMIQIARMFFKKDNLLIAVSGIIIAANAGGAFSPIDDVTTIMLWLADKFSATSVIIYGFLPSFVLYTISTLLLSKKIVDSDFDVKTKIITKLSISEKIIITVILSSFLLTIVTGIIGLPPYFGLLIGLGISWVLIDLLKKYSTNTTHLEASIDEFIKKTDIVALKFFIGILLAVAALHQLGILEQLSGIIYGANPSINRIIAGNIGLGLISPVLDNVPLTAMAIQIINSTNEDLWVLLALSVGTGGSLLIIGSAAGVVAMGMVKELNFETYFKIAFIPALIGFIGCITIWGLQFFLF